MRPTATESFRLKASTIPFATVVGTQRGTHFQRAKARRVRHPARVSQIPPEFYEAFPRLRCRVCQAEVQADDASCPGCRAPRPALAEFHGEGYEWRTAATWMGFPLIHIAFGMDATGRGRVAGGIIAIGQRARGAVAIGVIAQGFVAIGVVAVGGLSLGIVALGGLAALGCNALAPCAIGVVAGGYWAGGLSPWGWKILFAP